MRFTPWILAALLGLAPLGAVAAETVGLVTRAQPKSFQKLDGPGFILNNASPVYRDALVYTERFGSAQIRLDDGTDLMLSPSSSIVIDAFVYSGDGAEGSFAMSLVSGALRVISGRMAKPSYRVSTAVASIGVRGTTYWLDVDEPGLTKIWVDEGAVEARPVRSGELFVFTAPVYAECNIDTCYETSPPPKPVKFPHDPTRR